jgi:hypothetical protein
MLRLLRPLVLLQQLRLGLVPAAALAQEAEQGLVLELAQEQGPELVLAQVAELERARARARAGALVQVLVQEAVQGPGLDPELGPVRVQDLALAQAQAQVLGLALATALELALDKGVLATWLGQLPGLWEPWDRTEPMSRRRLLPRPPTTPALPTGLSGPSRRSSWPLLDLLLGCCDGTWDRWMGCISILLVWNS